MWEHERDQRELIQLYFRETLLNSFYEARITGVLKSDMDTTKKENYRQS